MGIILKSSLSEVPHLAILYFVLRSTYLLAIVFLDRSQIVDVLARDEYKGWY